MHVAGLLRSPWEVALHDLAPLQCADVDCARAGPTEAALKAMLCHAIMDVVHVDARCLLQESFEANIKQKSEVSICR